MIFISGEVVRYRFNDPDLRYCPSDRFLDPRSHGHMAHIAVTAGSLKLDAQGLVGSYLHYFHIASVGLQVRPDSVKGIFNFLIQWIHL